MNLGLYPRKVPTAPRVFLKSIDMESVNKKYPYGLMMIRSGKIPMFRQLNNYIISIASSNRISPSPLSHQTAIDTVYSIPRCTSYPLLWHVQQVFYYVVLQLQVIACSSLQASQESFVSSQKSVDVSLVLVMPTAFADLNFIFAEKNNGFLSPFQSQNTVYQYVLTMNRKITPP